MKISKVDHTRAGVNEKKHGQKGTESILYFAPPDKNGKTLQNISVRVDERNTNAQGLYTVLTPDRSYEKKKYEIKILNQIANSFNTVIKAILKNCADADRDIQVKKEIAFFKEYDGNTYVTSKKEFDKRTREAFIKKMYGKDFFVTGVRDLELEEKVHLLVQNSTRSALRITITVESKKRYLPDVLEKLVLAVVSEKKSALYLREISDDELKGLLSAITKDFRKDEQMNNIKTSLINQNVKVKINESGYLVPSYIDHGKRKYIFEFMKEYAGGDVEKKQSVLKRIRELIVLYYCGRNAYDEACEQAASWTFGIFKNKEHESICSPQLERRIRTYQETRKKDRSKKELHDINEELQKIVFINYRDCIEVLRTEKGIISDGKINNEELFTDRDFFWMDHIEKTASKLINVHAKLDFNKLSKRYLCEETWKVCMSFAAQKFIDYGKAVYHFAIPDLMAVKRGEKVKIGEVLDEYKNGITSFDYERIKAEESLERDISGYLVFAINNFAGCLIPYEKRAESSVEDVLLYKPASEADIDVDFMKRVFMFFGGISEWEDSVTATGRSAAFLALKTQLYQLRNATFHYTGKTAENVIVDPFIRTLFQEESKRVGKMYGKKYYSNNVYMYYKDSAIRQIEKILYQKRCARPAQIPSFENVMSRKEYRTYLPEFFRGSSEYNKLKAALDEKGMKQYHSSLYFIMKEAYYYGFLQLPARNLKSKFFIALKELQDEYNKGNDRNKKQAVKNFIDFYFQLDKGLSFGEVCQAFITEFMLQNTDGEKVLAEVPDKNSPDKESFAHFKMVLYAAIRKAFIGYLQEDSWNFLKSPDKDLIEKECREEDFCNLWNVQLFTELDKEMEKNKLLYGWYTTAHFMHPKQLNFLIGSIRNYIQYVSDIDRRVKSIRGRRDKSVGESIRFYNSVLQVLDFVQNFVGKISNKPEDYFESSSDTEEYAKFLSNFVDFKNPSLPSYHQALVDFCDRDVTGSARTEKLRIYHDPKKQILNRNVILAKMYGNVEILRNCVAPVTFDEINNFYTMQGSLESIFKKSLDDGKYVNTEIEQKKLRKYQRAKNRIELYDITEYTELLNDLIGQMVSWAYLRERDAMYFQLGYYYTKLFFTEAIPEGHFLKTLDKGNIHLLDGAILYQLIAINTYALHVIRRNEDNQDLSMGSAEGSASGSSLKIFKKNYCHTGGDEILNEGMELFERSNEREAIRKTRNYVDHFEYFRKQNRSILELFSEVYDRFFTYDTKLKKSVTIVLQNILMRYHMDARIAMQQSQIELTYITDTGKAEPKIRNSAKITLDNGMESTCFNFKVRVRDRNGMEKVGEVKIPVYEMEYVDQVKKILEYKKL